MIVNGAMAQCKFNKGCSVFEICRSSCWLKFDEAYCAQIIDDPHEDRLWYIAHSLSYLIDKGCLDETLWQSDFPVIDSFDMEVIAEALHCIEPNPELLLVHPSFYRDAMLTCNALIRAVNQEAGYQDGWTASHPFLDFVLNQNLCDLQQLHDHRLQYPHMPTHIPAEVIRLAFVYTID